MWVSASSYAAVRERPLRKWRFCLLTLFHSSPRRCPLQLFSHSIVRGLRMHRVFRTVSGMLLCRCCGRGARHAGQGRVWIVSQACLARTIPARLQLAWLSSSNSPVFGYSVKSILAAQSLCLVACMRCGFKLQMQAHGRLVGCMHVVKVTSCIHW